MKDTKRRMELYTFFDHTGISKHLEEMAQKGWMLEKITSFFWVYRRIEPRKLQFAVSYYPKASEFDPEPSENQKTFHDFCEHAGWKLVCTAAQMQVFYNEEEHPVPIETEPELELQAIVTTAKKNFIPVHIMLLLLAFWQEGMLIYSFLENPIGLFANAAQLTVGTAFLPVAILCIVELGNYFIWRSKATKAAAQGIFLDVPNTSKFQKWMLIILLAATIWWILNIVMYENASQIWIMAIILIYTFVIIALVNGLKGLLKRRKVPRGINLAVTVIAAFVLTFLMTGVVAFFAMTISEAGDAQKAGETEASLSQGEVPLSIEALVDVEQQEYSTDCITISESVLLGEFAISQYPQFETEDYPNLPWLEYTVVDVKVPFLYGICKNQLIREQKERYPDYERAYRPEDADAWGAKEVYRSYDTVAGAQNRYLLCYDTLLVEIKFDWEPSDEQMKTVAECFASA